MEKAAVARRLSMMGCIHSFLAVALGAFGSHLLKATLDPSLYETFRTAAYYQLVHAIALLILSLMSFFIIDLKKLNIAGHLLHFGILLFSGSLYILVLTGIRKLGIVTPIGGLCFLSGWLLLAFAVYRGFHTLNQTKS